MTGAALEIPRFTRDDRAALRMTGEFFRFAQDDRGSSFAALKMTGVKSVLLVL